jgi:hypothetical protein
MPGAARGDGTGRLFTNQSEIDGAVVRHPPEVVLLARGPGGLDWQARSAARVAGRPRRTRRIAIGRPFFASRAGRNRIVVVLTDDTDWEEIRELVTESYRILAPKKLTANAVLAPG